MNEKILEGMRSVMRVQGYDGNWNYDPYMQGMYNGMELLLSMAEGRQPEFREAPEVWLKDIATDEHPISAADSIESTELPSEAAAVN